MRTLREHPLKVTLFAFALATGAVVAIAAAYGFDAFADAWRHPHPGWLIVAICAVSLALPAYVVGYRAVAQMHGGPRLPLQLAAQVVVAGFGPFAVGGGFALDRRALHAVDDDQRAATVRVLGLGALEWALLAPAAWISAVILLAEGHTKAMPSLLWPWAIAVPIGFPIGLWLTAPRRVERLAEGRARRAEPLLRGVGMLHALARDPRRAWAAWIGTTLYWALDIAAFYASARFVGIRLGVPAAILAYATGYALTRRSLPLGGAGATEVMMTFALHWVGEPVPVALAAVVVYRVFNFVLPTLPALIARPHVKPLLDASDDARVSAADTCTATDSGLLAHRSGG